VVQLQVHHVHIFQLYVYVGHQDDVDELVDDVDELVDDAQISEST